MFLANTERANLRRSERSVVDALAPSPGVLLCGILAESRKRTRELDVFIIRPTGFAVVEVKGTTMVGELVTDLNGDWTIAGAPADFAGGANPVHQTRTAAAAASGHLSRGGTRRVFVEAICAVSGDVDLSPHRVGDVWVCRTDQVPAVLLALANRPVSAEAGAAAAAAFGSPVDADTLAVEGFEDGDDLPTPEHAPRPRDEARRREMEAVAMRLWRVSHQRLVLMCAASVLLSAYFMTTLTWASALAGVSTAAAVGVWQLRRRAKLAGLRMTGPAGVAAWIVTLTPYAGAGAALSTPWVFGVPHTVDGLWLIQFYACTLVALALLLVTRAGRCGYIDPPPDVAERLTAAGEPSGSYVIVPAGTQTSYGLGLVDPLDPRSKMLGAANTGQPSQ